MCKTYILFWGISIALLFSCTNSGDENQTGGPGSIDPEAFFRANPQPVAEQEVSPLELGAKAPDFELPGTDLKWHSLESFKDSKILVIIFSCNHCPTAQAYEDRMIALYEQYHDQGVAMAVISPNSQLGLLYNELGYTDLDDSFEAMKIRAAEKNFPFPYLYDGDDHAASLQYGPVATPHAFVFDEERKLRYRGRLDAKEKPGTGNNEDIRAAIDAILAGEEVANPETKTFGCSTKWAWKTAYKEKIEAEWYTKEVNIEPIDEEGIKALRKNDTDKLLLINVWATWCGPCINEYPDLLVTHQMYEGRDFEFVSISADRPDRGAQVLKFLKKIHSPVRNYHFSVDDPYLLAELIDPEWSAALPYTILIEPGGNVAYRHQGLLDILELRRTIVEHEMMGRVY